MDAVIGTANAIIKEKRRNRLSAETKGLIAKKIAESYSMPKTAKRMFSELIIECEEKGIEPPSYSTFCRSLKQYKNLGCNQRIKIRQRNLLVDNNQEYYSLEHATQKHVDEVFKIGIICHTELDIELMSSDKEEGKLGRPWLSLLIDAFSKKILAYYVTFELPSYRAIMMLTRECVGKYNRLPNTVICESGKEFQSVDLESLLADYGVSIVRRPSLNRGYGCIVERVFGATNHLFINTLMGGSPIINSIGKKKFIEVWTVELLNEKLSDWILYVYDQRIHPVFGLTIKEVFEQGVQRIGKCRQRYILYDDDFLIKTLSSSKGLLKLHCGLGIKLNKTYYWSPTFLSSGVENKKVQVRYDPYNPDTAYAYIDDKWEKLIRKPFDLS